MALLGGRRGQAVRRLGRLLGAEALGGGHEGVCHSRWRLSTRDMASQTLRDMSVRRLKISETFENRVCLFWQDRIPEDGCRWSTESSSRRWDEFGKLSNGRVQKKRRPLRLTRAEMPLVAIMARNRPGRVACGSVCVAKRILALADSSKLALLPASVIDNLTSTRLTSLARRKNSWPVLAHRFARLGR